VFEFLSPRLGLCGVDGDAPWALPAMATTCCPLRDVVAGASSFEVPFSGRRHHPLRFGHHCGGELFGFEGGGFDGGGAGDAEEVCDCNVRIVC